MNTICKLRFSTFRWFLHIFILFGTIYIDQKRGDCRSLYSLSLSDELEKREKKPFHRNNRIDRQQHKGTTSQRVTLKLKKGETDRKKNYLYVHWFFFFLSLSLFLSVCLFVLMYILDPQSLFCTQWRTKRRKASDHFFDARTPTRKRPCAFCTFYPSLPSSLPLSLPPSLVVQIDGRKSVCERERPSFLFDTGPAAFFSYKECCVFNIMGE